MQTRTRHSLSVDTISALSTAKNGSTWRDLAKNLGYEESYAAALNKAARGIPGAMTFQAENILRAKLGLAPIHLMEVAACPDCGQAHVGRCYNKPVIQVVVLAPGERVTTEPPPAPKRVASPRKRKPTKALRLPPDLWQTLNAERGGMTWAEYIERLAIDARTLRAMDRAA